jgi:dihydrofolate synthase/folylpolyglutamate synthase
MTPDWVYRRALRELWDRSSYERGLISDPFGDARRAELGLARMRALLSELDNPHQRAPAVHIAGSKGKGSTAAFIAAAAAAAGYRVGLYTSPHLHRFPERIAISGRPLADDRFAAVAEEVARAAARLESKTPELGSVTTFEFVTAMAFFAFARDACDLAVIEVGLGGTYDATNVIEPIVSAITRIDLEHTAVLGATHAAIAEQKTGILRPGVPCVSSPQAAEAAAVIARTAAERGSQLLVAGQDWTWDGTWQAFSAVGPWGVWRRLSLGLPGPHQVENACTALAALHFVDRAGIAIPESAAREGLAQTRWPGRFERVRRDGQEIIFDGAHTPAAAAALAETMRETLGDAPATVVVGLGTDKDIPGFLEAMRPLLGQLIITRADSPRAADPAAIAAVAEQMGIPFETRPSVAAAIATARERGSTPLVVTGSLFVAGEGREALGLATPDLEWRALNEQKTSPSRPPDRA